MKYTSPLHLLPERNTADLSSSELKRWKQELLLQFDLHQSATITVKDQEYDKNSILEAFELLKDSPEYHLRLYKNKPLLDFIEKQYIDFFDNAANWADWYDQGYRRWLGQWFIPVYSGMIYEQVAEKDWDSVDMLRNLYQSDFQLPTEWADMAYEKSHSHLGYFVKEAEATLDEDALNEREPIALKPEVHNYVNALYANLLSILPDYFTGIRNDYGDFAHNVIATVFYKERLFKSIDKKTLKTVEEAAKINIQIRDNEYSKKLLSDLRKYRREEDSGGRYYKRKSTQESGRGIWWVFVLIFFAFRILMNLDSCTDTNSYSTQEYQFTETPKKHQLMGDWSGRYKIEGVQRIGKKLSFAGTKGKMTMTIPNSAGKSCQLSSAFTWTYRHPIVSIDYDSIMVEQDFDAVANDTLQRIKQSILAKKKDRLIVHQMGSVIFLNDTKGFVNFTRTHKSPAVTAKRKVSKETTTTYQKGRQVTAFKPSKHIGQFNLRQFTDGDWYGVYSNEYIMAAASEVRAGQRYMIPQKWLTSKHGYTEAGRVKNIRYIDQKSNVQYGDLKVYFTLVNGLEVAFAP